MQPAERMIFLRKDIIKLSKKTSHGKDIQLVEGRTFLIMRCYILSMFLIFFSKQTHFLEAVQLDDTCSESSYYDGKTKQQEKKKTAS